MNAADTTESTVEASTSEIKVLDYGFVALVNTMGDDRTPARTARTSFRNKKARTEEEDARLTKYLVKHRHNTPLEFCQLLFYCKLPIFVARQFVRHRMQCLSGDMQVSFDLPGAEVRDQNAHGGGRQHYTISMRDLYRRWQRVPDGRPEQAFGEYYKRDRIKAMQLRSVDEKTGEVYHARIKDVWSSGVKDVYQVVLVDGSELRCTLEHRCLTPAGWRTLGEAIDERLPLMRVVRRPADRRPAPPLTETELQEEVWRQVVGINGYEVSSLGRVRGLRNTKGRPLAEPKMKELTLTPAGYHVVSLSANGVSRARLVHHLVLEAFGNARPEGAETLHGDGCRTNNRLTNLRWGSSADNALDRMLDGGDQRLSAVPRAISQVTYLGEEETYDLEVDGDYHNFVANGVVVHNSINEVSYRYVQAAREFYVPALDRMQKKAENNKQGSSEELVADPELCRNWMQEAGEAAFNYYEALLGEGVAPELARTVLPVSTYTEWYCQWDLHNFLHMIGLRTDPHAQFEIRVYAEAMLALAEQVYPTIIAAWRETRK